MHNSQSLKLLNKINRLFENLQDSDGMMNEIEKDLLLTYIRELYASIKYQKAVVIVPKLKEEEQILSPKIPQAEFTTKTSVVESDTMGEEPVPETTQADGLKKSPDSSKNGSERIEEEIIQDDNPLTELIQSHTELSSGYHGGSLISDLNKAFGLNDRIYYANELFQGDQLALIEMIAELNQCSTFEDVKNYLQGHSELTSDWNTDPKREAAVSFISLIRNKYK